LGPEEYIEQIDRVLGTCEFFENGAHFPSPIEILPESIGIFWSDTLQMIDGNTLKIRDRCFFDEDGSITCRNFRYSFRRPDSSLIFRFDSHGRQMECDEPGHVHDGTEEASFDILTCGTIDISYLVRCIKNFYTYQAQDWQENE
jgi:hypothetical protein